MPTIDALPFSSSTEQTVAALRSYLYNETYLPVEFVNPSNMAPSFVVYIPMYIFRVSFSANWHAAFGFDRQEHYTEYRTETYNNVQRTTPVTGTKTVTDWRPANGTALGETILIAYAGSNMPVQAVELIKEVRLMDVITIETSAIRVPVEPFTLSQDSVWSDNINSRLEKVIDHSGCRRVTAHPPLPLAPVCDGWSAPEIRLDG